MFLFLIASLNENTITKIKYNKKPYGKKDGLFMCKVIKLQAAIKKKGNTS